MLTDVHEDQARVQTTAPASASYSQILKSSALVGGSTLLSIAVGIVRTKVMAMLLGPAGFGLFGLYGSIVTLAQTLSGMGVNSSGVRQIAEASGCADEERVASTAVVLSRVSIVLGLLGAVLLASFSHQVSRLTFGDEWHASAVALLGVAVFFSLVSAGQGALIQGMRRIKDLASMGVLGALLGTAASIPIVYFYRDAGVVPALVAVSIMTAAISWWYSRKIPIHAVTIESRVIVEQTTALLKLGLAFMSSGLMTMGVAYAVRITVLRKVGLESAGLYQAAWTLGGLYVGFILQAMGADFYPRLTAVAADHRECNRLVNEQMHVGLLLAGPGVMTTLAFAPLVLSIFYSRKFGAAVEVLRWVCLGTLLQVITWPMGFIIVAKARQTLFILCEVAWTAASLGLAWVGVSRFGLTGAGMAFFGSYIFHGAFLYFVVRRLTGFELALSCARTIGFFSILITAAFIGFYVLTFVPALCIGVVGALLCAGYSILTLANLLTLDQMPTRLQGLLAPFFLRRRSSF